MFSTRFCLTVFVIVCVQLLEIYSHNVENIDQIKLEDYPELQTISGPEENESNIQVIYSSDFGPPDGTDYSGEDTASLDTWSIVWYIASFGGLILFFLIVSCSEWCCRRNARRGCQRQNAQTAVPVVPDTPPPSYDQFAPPSYEELWVGGSRQAKCEKTEYDVYVVPVHALGPIIETARNEDSPPSYQTSAGLADVSQLPRLHSYNASTSLT